MTTGDTEPRDFVVRGDAESDIDDRAAERQEREPEPAVAAARAGAGAPPDPAPAPGATMPAGDAARPGGATSSGQAPLFGDPSGFTTRWQAVQVMFVDEPRRAVEDADRLVTEMMDRLSELFRSQREDLEHAWNNGGAASTEDLRVALQRYRSFFERLLAT